MAISSINIQPATAHCFAHNDRSDKVTYLIDSSKENECSAPAPVAQKALAQMISEAEKYRKDNGLRAMKSDTVKAVEAVVNLNATHKLADVERLAEKIEAEFGFRAVQIAVHRDEGKSSSEKNYHAHIVMCNLTPEGTTIQRTLGRDGLKKLQDITARELGMERGKSSKVKHIDHKIYRVIAKEQENLLEKIDELQKENLAQGYTLKEYQARIVGLEGADTELRKELHAQNRDINKTQDLEAKERKITELEAKLTEIEGKNTDLSRNLEMVRSLRTDDKQKISELTEQVIAKDQAIDQLKEAQPEPINASLIVQLQDENKLLKIEKRGLERENTELKETKSAPVPKGENEASRQVEKYIEEMPKSSTITPKATELELRQFENRADEIEQKYRYPEEYAEQLVKKHTNIIGKVDKEALVKELGTEFKATAQTLNKGQILVQDFKSAFERTKSGLNNALKSTEKAFKDVFHKITGKSTEQVNEQRREQERAVQQEKIRQAEAQRAKELKTALELLKEDYARIKEAKEPLSNTDKIRGFVDQYNKEQEKPKHRGMER